MHRTIAVALFSLILSLAPRSYAQEASTGASPDGPRWYGWQTLTVDAIALGTMLSYIPTAGDTGSTPSSVLLGVGLTGYALGPPLVHLAHGRWKVGLGDLAIRVAAPVIAGAIGALIDSALTALIPCENICYPAIVGAGVGSIVGYAGAVTFDAVVLSREPGPSTLRPSASPPSTPSEDILAHTPARGLTLSPTLGAGPRGVSVGVVGSF